MKLLIRKRTNQILLLLTIFLVAGCSGNTYFNMAGFFNSNTLRKVSIESIEDSNGSAPVALDLLFIDDSTLMPELTALSSPEWFARKQALMLRYQQQITLVSVEIVPMTEIQSLTLPDRHKNAEHVVMFANYQASRGHRVAELSNYRKLKIRLERDRYQLLEMDKKQR